MLGQRCDGVDRNGVGEDVGVRLGNPVRRLRLPPPAWIGGGASYNRGMRNAQTTGIFFAVMAAVSASVIPILARIGMKEVPPVLATAVRSVVMMVFCITVAAAMGLGEKLHTVHGKAIWMIVLSGIAGAASWMFGFIAYDKIGVAKTSPLDKLSVPLAVVLAVIFLGEQPSRVNWVGIGMIAGGAYLAAIR